MKTIDMSEHDFVKQNLITDSKMRDHYKCSVCGTEGYRQTLAPFITVTEQQYKNSLKCVKPVSEKQKALRPKKVLLQKMTYIGIDEDGVYDVVECPDFYKGKYDNDVWVFSTSRNEAVRLMTHEILDREY